MVHADVERFALGRGELDLEWFFDEKTGQLYFAFNGTSVRTGEDRFVATATWELFHVEGTQANPVKDVTFRGLELRDTRITYLDAHGMPSGGDWGLQRSAAVFFQSTEGCTVDASLLTRLDGNGVFFSGYNRNGVIVLVGSLKVGTLLEHHGGAAASRVACSDLVAWAKEECKPSLYSCLCSKFHLFVFARNDVCLFVVQNLRL